MREVAVIGIGGTKFASQPEKSLTELGQEACIKAIKDAGVSPRDIERIYAGNLAQWQWGQGIVIGQVVARELGITDVPIVRVENGCATGSTAFHEAWYKIATGDCDIAMAFGVEQMTVVDSSLMLSLFCGRQYPEREGDMGYTGPGLFALMASRHMAEFGTTREQLAMVTAKNRKFGSKNPLAQLTKPVSVEDVLNDRMISDPLTLSQCCPRGDGSAAVILASKEVAKKYTTKPVYVAASILNSGRYSQDVDFTGLECDQIAAKQLYEQAGIGPDEIDLAEVHDCFSMAEIVHYEDLGFCEKGEGGRFVEEGHSDLGGKLPVNTSGGLLSKGHVIGATGVSQITEVVKQLRGNAGERQVQGAKVGLQHNGGGFIHTDAACVALNLFKL